MNADIVIAVPITTTLEQDAHAVILSAEAVEIVSADAHREALEIIKSLRAQERAIHDHFEAPRKAADSAKKAILKARDALVKPLAAARQILSGKAVTYQQEQERIAREAREKAEAEAREAQRKADEEARLAEEKRLAALEVALEEGDDAKAEEIMEEEPEITSPIMAAHVPAPEVAKISGASTRTTWSAEVVDKAELIKFVATSAFDRHILLEPNMKELNRIAVIEKDGMTIPGVRAVSKTSVVTR